jgi:hypothetical protein
MKKQLITMLIALVSYGAYAQHDHSNHAATKEEQQAPIFKDEKMGAAYNHYIHLKDALVSSNSEEAKKAAVQLQKSLNTISGAKEAISENTKLVASSTISEQRKVFSLLSNEMAKLVKANKLSQGLIYLEFCPMANNNAGAFWLSNEKEIKNPYFGEMMLKCGSVKETLQ